MHKYHVMSTNYKFNNYTNKQIFSSFQSGRQGPRHPAPGAPYYAVGFPRHSLLPDTPLGRQVIPPTIILYLFK